MTSTHRYHDGELSVQRQAGTAELAQRLVTMISPQIPDAAIDFVGHQHLVVAATIDPNGNP